MGNESLCLIRKHCNCLEYYIRCAVADDDGGGHTVVNDRSTMRAVQRLNKGRLWGLDGTPEQKQERKPEQSFLFRLLVEGNALDVTGTY